MLKNVSLSKKTHKKKNEEDLYELIWNNLPTILSSDKKQSAKECSWYALLCKKEEEIKTYMYIFPYFCKKKVKNNKSKTNEYSCL